MGMGLAPGAEARSLRARAKERALTATLSRQAALIAI